MRNSSRIVRSRRPARAASPNAPERGSKSKTIQSGFCNDRAAAGVRASARRDGQGPGYQPWRHQDGLDGLAERPALQELEAGNALATISPSSTKAPPESPVTVSAISGNSPVISLRLRE
jgi:hypothetical protein